MIAFTVYGEPVAQGRPRASTIQGHVVMYDPKKSRDYKNYLKLVASQHKPKELLEGPLELRVDIYRQIPKSMPKYKAKMAMNGTLRPTKKPDVDNYVKGIKDALSGVIWKDDKQIVDLVARKFYGEPRIEIQVSQLEQERVEQISI